MFKRLMKIGLTLILLNLFLVNGYSSDTSIFILMATPFDGTSFKYLKLGRKSFTDRHCAFQNCFITDNPSFLNHVTEFDVVVFNAGSLTYNQINLPASRSKYQKYVLSNSQPSANYTISERYNYYFFNWTWSYILNSDISCPSIVIKDKSGHIIGPKVVMHWMNMANIKPTSKYVKHKLRNKKLAAAWIVTQCDTSSSQSIYVEQLRSALIQYGLTVDIFGECGTVKCLNQWAQTCFALIESYYYFYLSFENSISCDYVTENLLIALDHFAVPIVYGGANYTRWVLQSLKKFVLSIIGLGLAVLDLFLNFFKCL